MGKKSRKRKQPRKWLTWVGCAAIPVSVWVFAWLMGAWDKDRLIPIDEVHVLDEDTFVVLGTSGQDSDVRRWSRIALLELDGTLHSEVQLEGELRFIGMTDDLIWLDHNELSIHARTLPELELVPGIGEAVKNHPTLSHKQQPVGFTADAVIVKGPDFKDYRVSKDGAIERADEDLEVVPEGRRMPRPEAQKYTREYTRELQELVKALDLTQPSLVVGQGGGVALPDPDSVLVGSFEFVKGGRSETLSRMTTGGELLWTTTAETLMDAMALEGQGILIDWVGMMGDELWALVEISEYSRSHEGDRYATHNQRLVRIDPQTGDVMTTHPVEQKKDG